MNPLDPEILERLRHLHLRARQLSMGLAGGAHRARRVGEGVEFSDYQAYLPGMDLRSLAWKVMARTDHLVVRRCEAETELDCVVALDLSGDLCTGGGRARLPDLQHEKAGVAITLAATLLWWLHAQGERVGLEVWGASPRFFAPGRGRAHLGALLAFLAGARPQGVAQLDEGVRRLGARLKRRAWVAVITDGMEEPSAWLPPLQTLGARGVDLRFVHLFQRGEWALSGDAPVRLFSPEGGGTVDLDPVAARPVFAEVLGDYTTAVRKGIAAAGGLYHAVAVEDDLGIAIAQIARGTSSWV